MSIKKRYSTFLIKRGVILLSVTPDIDQFTLVLQPTSLDFEFDEWDAWKADDLINTFLIKSQLPSLFGNIEPSDGGILKNYTEGYTFTNIPFYFRIAFHPIYVRMGISVYFSAYAWSEYRKRYEEIFQKKIHLHTFFNLIDSNEYSYRLSRVDLAIDFKNEDVNIAQIHRSLRVGRTEVRYRHG